jgi:hypothetical protein
MPIIRYDPEYIRPSAFERTGAGREFRASHPAQRHPIANDIRKDMPAGGAKAADGAQDMAGWSVLPGLGTRGYPGRPGKIPDAAHGK